MYKSSKFMAIQLNGFKSGFLKCAVDSSPWSNIWEEAKKWGLGGMAAGGIPGFLYGYNTADPDLEESPWMKGLKYGLGGAGIGGTLGGVYGGYRGLNKYIDLNKAEAMAYDDKIKRMQEESQKNIENLSSQQKTELEQQKAIVEAIKEKEMSGAKSQWESALAAKEKEMSGAKSQYEEEMGKLRKQYGAAQKLYEDKSKESFSFASQLDEKTKQLSDYKNQLAQSLDEISKTKNKLETMEESGLLTQNELASKAYDLQEQSKKLNSQLLGVNKELEKARFDYTVAIAKNNELETKLEEAKNLGQIDNKAFLDESRKIKEQNSILNKNIEDLNKKLGEYKSKIDEYSAIENEQLSPLYDLINSRKGYRFLDGENILTFENIQKFSKALGISPAELRRNPTEVFNKFHNMYYNEPGKLARILGKR